MPREKGTGELKKCDENGENHLRMDHFLRENWSAYNLYGFFVIVMFLSIMWLAITSPIMLQPGIKHETNEDDHFKIGCSRGLRSLNFQFYSRVDQAIWSLTSKAEVI